MKSTDKSSNQIFNCYIFSEYIHRDILPYQNYHSNQLNSTKQCKSTTPLHRESPTRYECASPEWVFLGWRVAGQWTECSAYLQPAQRLGDRLCLRSEQPSHLLQYYSGSQLLPQGYLQSALVPPLATGTAHFPFSGVDAPGFRVGGLGAPAVLSAKTNIKEFNKYSLMIWFIQKFL